MNLEQYEQRIIEAAIAAKRINLTKLAKQLGRSGNSVSKAIRGKSCIKSAVLEAEIVNALQPELDIINDALTRAQHGKDA